MTGRSRSDCVSVTVSYVYPYSMTQDPQAKQESESFSVPVATFERVIGELSRRRDAHKAPLGEQVEERPAGSDDTRSGCDCDAVDGDHNRPGCAIYEPHCLRCKRTWPCDEATCQPTNDTSGQP